GRAVSENLPDRSAVPEPPEAAEKTVKPSDDAGRGVPGVKGLAVDDPAGRLGETDPLDAALEPGGEVGRAGRHVGDQLGQAEDLRLLRAELRHLVERLLWREQVEPCCHPALSPAAQIALTLRAVGGLTAAEIARAFLVPEETMTRRISRAKRRIRDSGTGFRMPSPAERQARLDAVLHVLYLIFNEGYASTSGPALQRPDLAAEAIRLTRAVHWLLPDDSEVTGLLALMLLTDARRPARSGPDGALIP